MIETTTPTASTIFPAPPSPMRMMLRVFIMVFVVTAGAYGLSITGYLLLRLAVGERLFTVALLNSFVHLMVVPALVLLPLALLIRKWGTAALLVPGALAALMWYAPDLLPKPIPPAGDAPALTVATFNIASRSDRLDEIAALIRTLDADVIGLQEVRLPAEAALLAALAGVYPYVVSEATDRPVNGQMVFSRFPILRADVFPSPQGNRHQRVEIAFAGRTLVFYNLHVAYPFVANGFSTRTTDLRAVLALAEAETAPVILAGDFNFPPQSDDYALTIARYTDAFRAAGQGTGFTFGPRRGAAFARWLRLSVPIARIDYVFYGDGLRAVDSWVSAEAVHSDHYPVVARLVLE